MGNENFMEVGTSMLLDLPTVVDTLSFHSLSSGQRRGQDRLTKQLHHRRSRLSPSLSFEHLQNKRPFIIGDETDPFPTVFPMK